MTNSKKPANKKKAPLVSIVMGSQSDYETLKHTEQVMIDFSVSYEIQVVSAHRTPALMYKFAQNAVKRGVKVIIAGAGGICPSARYDFPVLLLFLF